MTVNPKLYSALRWGAIGGGLVGVLEAASYWGTLRLPTDAMLAPGAMGLSWFDWLTLLQLGLEWAAAMIAGWLAGREVGDRNFGLVAGLISGLIISLLSIAYQVVAPPPLELLTGPNGNSVDLIGGFVSNSLLSLMLGATGGWIGGWLATREQHPLM
jgi:hypothetical protein